MSSNVVPIRDRRLALLRIPSLGVWIPFVVAVVAACTNGDGGRY